MAPQPLESIQAPVTSSSSYISTTPLEGGPRSISLAMLIDFIIQRTYHELTVLSEL